LSAAHPAHQESPERHGQGKLRVVATDPGSVRDSLAFAKQTGNELVAHGEQDSEFWFVLKRR